MTQVVLKVALTRPDAFVPKYAHDGDSGMDLATPVDLLLEPGVPCFVDIGVAIELPPGHEGQIRSRSGLTKKGLTACSGVGTVDNSYRGSLGVTLLWHAAGDNIHSATWKIEAGTRIAQLVIAPVARAEIYACESVAEFTYTARGAGGFGSSGLNS